MEPWYKVALPRAEVREGRSFNPNEFAIAREQIVAGRGTASRPTDAAIEDAKALETVEKALYREKKTLKKKPRCVWLASGSCSTDPDMRGVLQRTHLDSVKLIVEARWVSCRIEPRGR